MATERAKRINHPRECCICFEDLEGHIVQTGCSHVYHFKCLNQWLTSHDTEGSSSTSGPAGVEIVDMTEEEEVAHVVNLTRHSIRLINNVCPICKQAINQEKFIDYVDYENKFARMDTDGLTEDDKKAEKKRKRANQKRAERRKRNKVNASNNS